MLEKIEETLDFIWRKTGYRPKIAVILGSGLGSFAEKLKDINEVKYEAIPNFPVSTVEGHEGKLIFGKLGGKEVVIMQGRFHYFEYPKIDEIDRFIAEHGIKVIDKGYTERVTYKIEVDE